MAHEPHPIKILSSDEGFYVGRTQTYKGVEKPYTVESGFYPTAEEAQQALDDSLVDRPYENTDMLQRLAFAMNAFITLLKTDGNDDAVDKEIIDALEDFKIHDVRTGNEKEYRHLIHYLAVFMIGPEDPNEDYGDYDYQYFLEHAADWFRDTHMFYYYYC